VVAFQIFNIVFFAFCSYSAISAFHFFRFMRGRNSYWRIYHFCHLYGPSLQWPITWHRPMSQHMTEHRHSFLGSRPVKNMGGWWRWALLSPDGVAPSRMVSVSASVNLPLHHKVQKYSSCTGSSGWSRKKDRKTVVVVVVTGGDTIGDTITIFSYSLTVCFRFHSTAVATLFGAA